MLAVIEAARSAGKAAPAEAGPASVTRPRRAVPAPKAPPDVEAQMKAVKVRANRVAPFYQRYRKLYNLADLSVKLDILSSRRRRPRGLEDLRPEDVPWFMWKTGTSSGRRDAWAVGHNGRCAIGVWVGRFSGAARLEFVGREAAEPLLARLFSLAGIGSDADPPPA